MTLGVILASPPMTTGLITLQRVERAAEVLGHSDVAIANLIGVRTRDVNEIAIIGTHAASWLTSRSAILNVVKSTATVLLAFGVTEPSGVARMHYREQLSWLAGVLEGERNTLVAFRGRPHHPSRWHRYWDGHLKTTDFESYLMA